MKKQQHQHKRLEQLKQQWLRNHRKATSAEFERFVAVLRWVCAR